MVSQEPASKGSRAYGTCIERRLLRVAENDAAPLQPAKLTNLASQVSSDYDGNTRDKPQFTSHYQSRSRKIHLGSLEQLQQSVDVERPTFFVQESPPTMTKAFVTPKNHHNCLMTTDVFLAFCGNTFHRGKRIRVASCAG